jgi:hypothetical protein
MKVLGLEVATKTDILALAAFLISLTTASYQLFSFLAGPQVIIAHPRQVLLYFSATADSPDKQLNIISTLSYVNRANSGNNAVVLDERVKFSLGDTNYVYSWHEFVVTRFQESQLEWHLEGERRLMIDGAQTAGPFVVNGGGATSHETLFAPRHSGEFIHYGVLAEEFMLALRGEALTIRFEFIADTLNDGQKIAACEILINERFANQILSDLQGWSFINCKQ